MFAGKQDLADDVENPYWQVHKNSLKDDTERITGNIHVDIIVLILVFIKYND